MPSGYGGRKSALYAMIVIHKKQRGRHAVAGCVDGCRCPGSDWKVICGWS